MGTMISVGQKLTADFRLVVAREGKLVELAFQDLLTRPTVVSIYMRNNTGSCDKQNDSLVAHAAEIDRLGYHLVAVSRDTGASHLKYAAKKGIAYVLASDPDDAFARAVDAIVEKSMYGKTYQGPARAAFVIATDGTVRAVIEKVDSKTHGEQVLAVLRDL
jgi:thioredoxin-dependent peroxiredoxin